jgi:anaerobic selenocysteine-containing dehydrogenase
MAVVHHTNGVHNYRAVFMLAGLTGNFDVPGGNIVVKPAYVDVPSGFDTNILPFTMPVPWRELKPRMGQAEFPVWCEFIDEAQAMLLPDYIMDDSKPYPVKAVIGFGLNYRMWPDSDRMKKALMALDFFVNLDPYMTDTCQFADIVLPVCTSVERSEFKSYPGGFVIHTLPVIDPLYNSVSDLDFIYELAKRLGLDDELFQNGYEASINYILEPSGMTMKELIKHPGGMVSKAFKPPVFRKYENGLPTPSGKMEFVSGVVANHQSLAGHHPLPVYNPPGQSAENSPELFKEYPFTINTGSRLPMFIHTRTFRLPWAKALRPKPAADINPDDAARLGLKQGDAIKICTPKGEISVFANITDMALEGVVFMYHAYSEANVNTLIDSSYTDPVSGYPGFKSFLGKIVKEG